MKRLSALLAIVTIGAALGLGLAPTSVGLTNDVGSLSCKALLTTVDNASLVGAQGENDEVTQEWLRAAGSIDEGEPVSQELAIEANQNIAALCGEAQQGRLAWLVVVAVFGSALSLAAGVMGGAKPKLTQSTTRENNADV